MSTDAALTLLVRRLWRELDAAAAGSDPGAVAIVVALVSVAAARASGVPLDEYLASVTEAWPSAAESVAAVLDGSEVVSAGSTTWPRVPEDADARALALVCVTLFGELAPDVLAESQTHARELAGRARC